MRSGRHEQGNRTKILPTLALSKFLPSDISSRRKLSKVSRVFLRSVSSVAIRAERCASEVLSVFTAI